MFRRLMRKAGLLALPLWVVSGASPAPVEDVQESRDVLCRSYAMAGMAMGISWGSDGLETIRPVGMALGLLGRDLAAVGQIRRSTSDFNHMMNR